MNYAIIEVDDGLTVIEIPEGMSLEDAAIMNHGTLAEGGPYASYEEACDALAQMDLDEELEP